MEKARRTGLVIKYNGKNLPEKLKNYIEDFSYTDVATGESDSAEFTMNNRDLRFMDKNMPKKGDALVVYIRRTNWKHNGDTRSFKCGKFTIDDISFSGPQNEAKIGAVSVPAKTGFKYTKRSHTYKNITVEQLAKTITKRAGIALHYSAKKIRIKKIEQNKEADSDFILSVCEEYGLGVKIYNGKIVIYDEEAYEKKKTVKTFSRTGGEVIDWDWNTTLQGTYTGAKVRYTDTDDNKEHKITIGKKGRMLDVDVSAWSKNDAILKAKAKLAAENKKWVTMTLTIFPDKNLVATDTIRLTGFRKLSGKYFIDSIAHTVAGNGIYKQVLNLHKVRKRIGG